MTLLANSLEGGTSGNAISAANSGGASGNAFDSVTIGTGATVAYDNAHAAHGGLGAQIATTGTSAAAFLQWSTSMGSQTTIWFRLYAYFTANPGVTTRLFRAIQTPSALCAALVVTTGGLLSFQDSAGAAIITSATAIPLNTWFRVEGFVTGSATTGQLEMKLFKTADSLTADDTQTSTAAQNTLGAPNGYAFGQPTTTSVIGPYWEDDLALSNVAYIGPAATPPPPAALVVPQAAVMQAACW